MDRERDSVRERKKERETERGKGESDEGVNLHARDHVFVQGLISNSMCMCMREGDMHINLYVTARDVPLFDG